MSIHSSAHCVSIDWLSVTVKNGCAQLLPNIVKSGHYHVGDGRYGYKASRKFISGVIEYSAPVREVLGTHIVYSGKALQYLRDMGAKDTDILRFHAENGHKVTRLDVAVDITNSGMDIAKLFRDYENGKVNTLVRSKASAILKSNGSIETMYIGSKKKRTKLIRIYNKAIEQNIPDEDWVRVEYETRQQNAVRAVEYIASSGMTDESMKQLIRGFCEFTDDEIWKHIFDSEPAELPTYVEPKNNTLDWLLKSCAPALAKEIIKDPRVERAFYDRVAEHIEEFFTDLRYKNE